MHDMNEPERLSVSAHLVDARGKACPMPIVELAQALLLWREVELWADDPAAWGDLRAFTSATGHQLLTPPSEGRVLRAVIRHK